METREKYRHVLSPIRIGGVEVPNRVVRTAHATGFAAGEMSDRLIAYHEARARGGVGLTIVEIMGVVALFGYLNRWNDVMATPLENDAALSAKELLASWDRGRH